MKMYKTRKWMLLSAFLVSTMTASLNAGQIVTPQLKQWAHKALQQEKQLATISKPNTVAVLYFQNFSGNPEFNPVQKGMTVMLISDLSRLDMFTIIERTELQALVEELGLGQSGLVDPDGAPRIGRLLQADKLIGGALLQGTVHPLNISASVLDVVPEKVLNLDGTKGDLQGLIDLEKQLLHQFVAALKLELSPEQKKILDKPLTRNHEALLALFKGVDAGDHGRYDEAAEHYSRALEHDPQLKLAKESLEELNALGLLKNTAQRRRMLHQMRQATSFSTTLNPPLPLSRIPQPAGVGSIETPTNQEVVIPPAFGAGPAAVDRQQ